MANVMVVEDESVVAMDLCAALAACGHDVSGTFMTGADAVRAAPQVKPDLILMDVRLRGPMDGIEAAGHIRKAQDLPIIFLTAFADQATVARATLIEPYGYLLKPYNDKELRATVDLALYKHRREGEVKERERWFSTTLRSIGDAVIATDLDGQVRFMNAMAERLTGWSTKEALARPLAEVLHLLDERTRAPVPTPAARALAQNAVVGLATPTLLVARDGVERPIDDSAAPIYDDLGNPTGAVIVFRDISERRQLEAKLATTQRLATLGTFTAGVAHELNNPLAYVIANQGFALEELASLIARGGAPDPADQSRLEEVCHALREGQQGAGRAARIVSDLKTFSRPQQKADEVLWLERILDEASRLSWSEVKGRAGFVRDFRASPLVKGDEAQLVQVFVNLLVNAAQAIPEGSPQKNQVRLVLDVEAGAAVVRVEDTGCGMTPELMVRIFDPFFTTKAIGVGTGLGLSICHGIVTAHGGQMTIQSKPAQGTVFRVQLPAAG